MAQFKYTEIVYGFLFDAFVLNYAVAVTDVIGAILITGSLFTVSMLKLKGKLK